MNDGGVPPSMVETDAALRAAVKEALQRPVKFVTILRRQGRLDMRTPKSSVWNVICFTYPSGILG
jgi:hypothetical protein